MSQLCRKLCSLFLNALVVLAEMKKYWQAVAGCVMCDKTLLTTVWHVAKKTTAMVSCHFLSKHLEF